VLVQTDDGKYCPALVVRVAAGGGVTVVAFSDEWPLTAARVFRDLPHVDSLRVGGNPPTWLWPPRVETPAGGELASVAAPWLRDPRFESLDERVAELELEQRALARALAALVDRVAALEAGFVGEMP
jgi:hypothetical protein